MKHVYEVYNEDLIQFICTEESVCQEVAAIFEFLALFFCKHAHNKSGLSHVDKVSIFLTFEKLSFSLKLGVHTC